MVLFVTGFYFLLQSNFIFNGFQRLDRLPIITFLLRTSHLFWLCIGIFLMFYRRLNGGDTSVGGLVGTASFVCNGSVNIIIILESIFKQKYYKRFLQLQKEVDHLIADKLQIQVQSRLNYRYIRTLLFMLMLQIVCDGLKIWINTISKIQPVFWYTLPTSISLRVRYFQLIYTIMTINGRVEIFKKALSVESKKNEPKSPYATDIWQPYTEEEYHKVNYMRLIYMRIWEAYRAINDCFSWSILFLFMTSFFDIICNCYWTFTAIYKGQVFHKYVLNGATSMSLSSLVIMLFYYTDSSNNNYVDIHQPSSSAMRRALHNYSQNSSGIFIKILMFFPYLGLWIFGMTPFTKCYLIYQFYIVVWCSGLCISCYMAIVYDIIDDEDSLNGLVSAIMFAAHLFGHLVLLADSWKMRHYRRPLYENFIKIEKMLEQKLQNPLKRQHISLRLGVIIIVFGCLIGVAHAIIIWTTFKTKSAATLLYWRSLCSYLALQFKTLEFLLAMVQVNYFIDVMLKNIQKMGERSLQRVFNSSSIEKSKKFTFMKVLSLYQDKEDEQQLEILKSAYSEIYLLFQFLNRAYGWSLLASTAVYFVDFVCNTYWILLLIITQGRDFYALLQNACFAMLAFVLLSLLCWMCEKSDSKSRFIGCLISKLVKPLGNKRYNDLVSEFSIQTLHQRFVVTAKEFFHLNLGLLGSMVAAIVTYLVILIQFMFTEKSRKEHKISTKIPTTTLSSIMSNVSSSLKTTAVTFLYNATTPSAAPAMKDNVTSSVKEVIMVVLADTMTTSITSTQTTSTATNSSTFATNVTIT